MSIVKIDILNHADYGVAFREDYEVPGISRFYTAIESVRKNNPEHTLLLDAGDNFKSWLWHENVQEGIALLKTDVYEYGNHDFDWGQENIEVSTQRLLDLGVPIVCSNVVEKATGNLVKGARPYVVFEKGGIKYGVLGLITEYTPYMVTYKYFLPYKVIDSVECARKYIPMMREEGAEVIIVLTHYPFYFTETDESGELIDILDQIIDLKPDCMIGGHIPGVFRRRQRRRRGPCPDHAGRHFEKLLRILRREVRGGTAAEQRRLRARRRELRLSRQRGGAGPLRFGDAGLSAGQKGLPPEFPLGGNGIYLRRSLPHLQASVRL